MRAGSVGGGDGGLVKRMAEWRVASEGRESRGVVVGPWDPAPTLARVLNSRLEHAVYAHVVPEETDLSLYGAIPKPFL